MCGCTTLESEKRRCEECEVNNRQAPWVLTRVVPVIDGCLAASKVEQSLSAMLQKVRVREGAASRSPGVRIDSWDGKGRGLVGQRGKDGRASSASSGPACPDIASPLSPGGGISLWERPNTISRTAWSDGMGPAGRAEA